MGESLNNIHFPLLLLVGAALLVGSLGGRIFQWLRIPQVVGYIAIGLLIGRSGLGILDQDRLQVLMPFNFLALGVIGFVIGSELSLAVFRTHGKQFIAILLAEGIGAFIVVGLAVGGITYALTQDTAVAVAIGAVLGAIASATAPAATTDVLWEYRTKGILTTTVLAIVALDDALALFLFALAASLATIMLGAGGSGGLGTEILRAVYELVGALVLGGAAGLLLNWLLRITREQGRFLTFVVGMLAAVLGLAMFLKVDLILCTMALGMTLVNAAPRRSRQALSVLESFAPPIYVLFFVVVGARLSVENMPLWMWGLAVAYVVGRTVGKMTGAWLGAKMVGAAASVRKYLGLCLFSQAGVAIGLSIVASINLADVHFHGISLGDAVVMIITTTTFLVQIIGPPCVKYAVFRAGEVGLNITEDSLIASCQVKDVMDAQAPFFPPEAKLSSIFHEVASSDAREWPVVSPDKHILGIITMDSLKQGFASEESQEILVAFDLMEPAPDPVHPDLPCADALTQIRAQGTEGLPVVDDTDAYVGMLEQHGVRRRISQELFRREQMSEKKSQA